MYIFYPSCSVFLRMGNASEKKNIVLCLRSATFFSYAVYEIVWKNMVVPDRPQMTM